MYKADISPPMGILWSHSSVASARHDTCSPGHVAVSYIIRSNTSPRRVGVCSFNFLVLRGGVTYSYPLNSFLLLYEMFILVSLLVSL